MIGLVIRGTRHGDPSAKRGENDPEPPGHTWSCDSSGPVVSADRRSDGLTRGGAGDGDVADESARWRSIHAS
jgi:hypothetical protein